MVISNALKIAEKRAIRPIIFLISRTICSDLWRLVRTRGSEGESVMIHNAFSVSGILKEGMPGCIPMVCDLREGREVVKGDLKNRMWRYELTGNRCAAVLRRYRDETLRCVATRRHTSGTGAVSGSEDLEKTAGFRVNLRKWFALFQCSVNWSRARLNSSLIAGGASGSRGKFSAGCVKDAYVVTTPFLRIRLAYRADSLVAMMA